MEKMKLISIRLDPSILWVIDALAYDTPYLTRSAIIQRVLAGFLKCAAADDVRKLVHSFDPYDDGFEIYIKQRKNFTK